MGGGGVFACVYVCLFFMLLRLCIFPDVNITI